MTTSPTRPRGKMNNSFSPEGLMSLPQDSRELVERRERLLGPAYRLFYNEPVHFSKGKGARLWDADGAEYLDAYNNVVSVGHANPRVNAAVAEQMETLCTHTRYLSEGVLNYAENLLGTMGGHGRHMMFTCTGSEANDLALRIAQHHTGNLGIIVTSEAYHGNSHLTAGFSPSLGEYSPLGQWVRTVPTPDSYRIPQEELGNAFVEHVREQIKDLQRHGQGLAAFVVDSLFTSDGIYSQPTNFLAKIAEVVREAGGLFIADEVQCGFGRTGEAMWGYQRHGFEPDIITLGKPMGNGYPVAGIAVDHNVVSTFGYDMRYFNTFGGNNVAMAAAQATLDVIQDEGLVGNSLRIGDIIREGLEDLAERYECIGDVRGAGLYLGAEIVSNRDTKTPDGPTATAIVNGLRARKVLISATGVNANVLKIRPPLVFSSDDAARLLSTLEDVLADSSSGHSTR